MSEKTHINNNGNIRNIVFFGIGAVGSCCVCYFNKFFDSFKFSQFKMIDKNEDTQNVECVKKIISKGASFLKYEIKRDNVKDLIDNILSLKKGDIIIDLTTITKSILIIKLCVERQIHYFNSALNEDFANPMSSIHIEQMHALAYNDMMKHKATSVIETGMNPGLISVFTKRGLRKVVKLYISQFINDDSKKATINLLTDAFSNNDYALMAKTLQLRIIICSENDTQKSKAPPTSTKFCNTWSSVGLIEEYLEPLEIGIGSHETVLPFKNTDKTTFVTPNLLYADDVISGELQIESIFASTIDGEKVNFFKDTGGCVRHGECMSMARFFSGHSYSPTIYFSYRINQFSKSLLENTSNDELDELTFETLDTFNQTHKMSGYDNIGAVLVFEKNPFNDDDDTNWCWWSGSVMNVNYVKTELNDDYFLPTTIQVMAGILSAVSFALENPTKGIIFPEDLDDKFIIKKINKYMGKVYNGKTNLELSGVYLKDVVKGENHNTDRIMI